ncbi:MAG: nitroreductase family protein [Mahellales bacterium]
MMNLDVIEAIKSRRSIRMFDNSRPVDDDILKEIITCGTWAPSAHNNQPWRFVVIRDPKKKEQMAMRSRWAKFLTQTPVAIVVIAEFSHRRKVSDDKAVRYFSVQDTAAAIQNILLAATNYGLGTCWIGDFDEGQLAEMCNIPEGWNPVCIIAMGYPHPDFKPAIPRRKLLQEVMFYETL